MTTGGERQEVDGRLGEHDSARYIESAGHDIDHVDEPGSESTEALGADTDSAVDGRGTRLSGFGDDGSNRVRRNTTDSLGFFRADTCGSGPDNIETVRVLFPSP